MTDTETHADACQIVGCTDRGEHMRWVVTIDGSERSLMVCWKHESGELDDDAIDWNPSG